MLYQSSVKSIFTEFNQRKVPYWGDTGNLLVPLYTANQIERTSYGLVVPLPEPANRITYLPKVKFDLQLQGVRILSRSTDSVVLEDPEEVITEDWVGGIIEIARFLDSYRPCFHQSRTVYLRKIDKGLCELLEESNEPINLAGRFIDEDGNLVTNFLHEIILEVDNYSFSETIQMPWTGSNSGVLVPYRKSTPATMHVNSWVI